MIQHAFHHGRNVFLGVSSSILPILLLLFALFGPPSFVAAEEAPAPINAVKISCIARGIYKVTGEELARIGVDLAGIDVDHMALVHYDQSVPILLTVGVDHHFKLNDALYFFSEGSQEDSVPFINIQKDLTPSTQTFMLHLVPSGHEPLRYQTVSLNTPDASDPDHYFTKTLSGRIHFKKDPIWKFFEDDGSRHSKTNYLFWEELTYPASDRTRSSMRHSFTVPMLNPRQDAFLRVKLFAVSELAGGVGRHHLSISLNEQAVGEVQWSGRLDHEARLSLPPRLLRKGSNTVTFTILDPLGAVSEKKKKDDRSLMGIDDVMLEWFDLEFKQNTDVQNNYGEWIIADQADREAATRLRIRNFTHPEVKVFDLAGRLLLLAKPFNLGEGSMLYGVNIERNEATTTTLIALSEDKMLKAFELQPVSIRGLFQQPVECDLLMLTHPAFIKNIEPLAQWKRSRGLKVHVTDITDIFNEKSGGYAAPEPLRAYIQYLYKNQKETKLKYVILVGDSSTICKYQTFCPAYAYLQSGTHANDNYFANFSNPVGLPQVAVGRFSVRTDEHINHVVQKIMDYESGKGNGPWQTRSFLMASAFNWARVDARDIISGFFSPHYQASYLQSDLQTMDPNYHLKLTDALMRQFNAGNLITIFFGHGGGTVWQLGPAIHHDDFIIHLFDQSNVAKLINHDRLPLVLAMTCYTNDFDNPTVPQTLGETFVNSEGGAIAVLGTTGRSSTMWNARFSESFLKQIASRKFTRLGDMFVSTKKEINDTAVNSSYVLLGDPSLEFKLPAADVRVQDQHYDRKNATATFSYQIPWEVKNKVTLNCSLLTGVGESVAEWNENVSEQAGSLKYQLDSAKIKDNALRVVVCLADQANVMHAGGAVFKLESKPKPELKKTVQTIKKNGKSSVTLELESP